MSPGRKRSTVLTSILLLICAAFLASPHNALSADSPTATATPATRLANISTRALIDVSDNVLIAGFIVTGTQAKKVVVRGIGPSLGFAGHLGDPTLELLDATGKVIKSDDNWKDSADKQAIFNTGLSPTNDVESAIIAILPANRATYTAVLRGANGGTGIGVLEIYDIDSATADSKLANISSRGLVSTNDNAMIAGTIVAGPLVQDVIIRALGPSLSVVNKLADPTLELRNSNGVIMAANDNWTDNPQSGAIFESGLAPTDPRESAIKATLPANNSGYTAIVRDASAASYQAAPATVTRIQHGSGNSVEIQRVQFDRPPVGGTFRLTFTRPHIIVSGQPGDKAALEDSITVPSNATGDDVEAAILASSQFYRYDQNNHLTAGPYGFHVLFDSGGGLGIDGNEGFRREPVVTRSATDLSTLTIQFGTLTTGAVGTRNTWITQLPLVQVDDSSVIYDGGVAVVEVYALQ